MKKNALIILLSVSTIGCSSVSDVEPAQIVFDGIDQSKVAIALALEDLAESASISADANKMISEVNNGLAAKRMTDEEYDEYVFQSSHIPIGMERSIEPFSWSGPVYQVLELMSKESGYYLAEPANKPVITPMVSFDKSDFEGKIVTVNDVIRAIERSNRDLIRIDIMEDARLIVLDYKI